MHRKAQRWKPEPLNHDLNGQHLQPYVDNKAAAKVCPHGVRLLVAMSYTIDTDHRIASLVSAHAYITYRAFSAHAFFLIHVNPDINLNYKDVMED